MTEYKGSGSDGNRMLRLEKEAKRRQEEFENKKKESEKLSSVSVSSISDRFANKSDFAEEKLKKATIGLVTFDDFQRTQASLKGSEQSDDAAEKYDHQTPSMLQLSLSLCLCLCLEHGRS
jgi:hypothetical protein